MYQSAGRAIISGASPFSVDGYLYPPLTAFLLVPLSRVDFVTGRWIWFLLAQACSIVSAFLLWRHLGKTLASACLVAIAWAVAADPLSEALGLGQATPLLLLPIVLGYASSDGVAGTALGIAAGIKLFPAILFPGLGIARDWGRFRWSLSSFALLTLGSVALLRALCAPPYSPPNKTYVFGTPAVLNFSIAGIALRVVDRPAVSRNLPAGWQFGNILQRVDLPIRSRVASSCAVVAILLFGYGLWTKTLQGHRHLEPQQRDLLIASLTSLSLAASPVVWSHYHQLSAPGAVVVASYALRLKRRYMAVLAGVALMLTYRVPYALLQWYASIYAWPSAGKYPAIWYLGTSVGCLASLTLMGMAWWLAVKAGSQRPA